MKLYVLGNGFDLAHNLDTHYSDYRTFIKNSLDKHPDWNDILDYYPKEHKFWSDAEYEICAIDIDRFYTPLRLLNFTDLNKLKLLINESFNSFVTKIDDDINKIKQKFTLQPNSIFLSFNYTEVLERIYNVKDDNVIHIHGSLKDAILMNYFKVGKGCVLGHSTNLSYYHRYLGGDISINKDYINFVKSTEKNNEFFIKSCNLRSILLSNQSLIDEVVFYGFSFSGADYKYLHELKLCLSLPNVRWTIYIHSNTDDEFEQGKDDFINKLIKYGFGLDKVTFKSTLNALKI